MMRLLLVLILSISAKSNLHATENHYPIQVEWLFSDQLKSDMRREKRAFDNKEPLSITMIDSHGNTFVGGIEGSELSFDDAENIQSGDVSIMFHTKVDEYKANDIQWPLRDARLTMINGMPSKIDSTDTKKSTYFSDKNGLETWWTVCGGGLHIISCSLSGWGTIEIELVGAIGALASTGVTKINRIYIEEHFESNKAYDFNHVSGVSVSTIFYSSIYGDETNSETKLFEIHTGGAAGVGGGTLNKTTFMY